MTDFQMPTAGYQAGIRANAIRNRLLRPANAVKDEGINLRRHREVKPQVITPKPKLPPPPHQVLQEVPRLFPKNIVAEIRDATCKYFEVDVAVVIADTRKPIVALARHVAVYIVRSKTKKSWGEIMPSFGYRDHTTLLHSWKRITRLLKTDEKLQRHIDAIWDTVNANRGPSTIPAEHEQPVAIQLPREAHLPRSEVHAVAETSPPALAHPAPHGFPDDSRGIPSQHSRVATG